MAFNKLIRPFVGADLSRPPPIYRPVMPGDAHGRLKYATSIIAPLHLVDDKLPGDVADDKQQCESN